uniref:Secreted protein n=1 Tax=Arundo donax TaxID=35708 RepID=A0A0A9DQJ3_ARUDO
MHIGLLICSAFVLDIELALAGCLLGHTHASGSTSVSESLSYVARAGCLVCAHTAKIWSKDRQGMHGILAKKKVRSLATIRVS